MLIAAPKLNVLNCCKVKAPNILKKPKLNFKPAAVLKPLYSKLKYEETLNVFILVCSVVSALNLPIY